jgi:hypothetical protein
MKISTFLAGCLLCAVGLAAQAESVPRDAAGFTDYMANLFRTSAGTTVVSVKAALLVQLGDEEVSVDKVFGFCQQKPDYCDKAAAYYASSVNETIKLQHAPIAQKDVLLVLRPLAYLANVRERLGAGGPQLVSRPFVDGWAVLPVLDTPKALRPLNERDLKNLGMEQQALFSLGASNLQTSLAPLKEGAKPAGVGEIGTLDGGLYEVSRVLLHEQWAELAAAQNGTLIVALPTSDRLLYVSEKTPKALDALLTLSKYTATRSSSPFAPNLLLSWTPQGWEIVR